MIHTPLGDLFICSCFSLSSLSNIPVYDAQAASILENSIKDCKYLTNWRNTTINGNPLSHERMQGLRNHTIPTSGSLKIDYVTYQVID